MHAIFIEAVAIEYYSLERFRFFLFIPLTSFMYVQNFIYMSTGINFGFSLLVIMQFVLIEIS
jgi:hypothetical protein